MTTRARIHELLASEGPNTSIELAERIGLTASGICTALKTMRAANEVHLLRFDENWQGKEIAVWKLGAGEDAKRRPLISQVERTRLYRERKKREDEERVKKAQQRTAVFRHPQDVWLFGEYGTQRSLTCNPEELRFQFTVIGN